MKARESSFDRHFREHLSIYRWVSVAVLTACILGLGVYFHLLNSTTNFTLFALVFLAGFVYVLQGSSRHPH